jgi:hypothetical protein
MIPQCNQFSQYIMLTFCNKFEIGNSAIRRVSTLSLTVETIAGGIAGYQDGFGAKFNLPTALAFGPTASTLLIADASCVIRGLNVQTTFTTPVIGTGSCVGGIDGVASVAQFSPFIAHMSYDQAGQVLYVAQSDNVLTTCHCIDFIAYSPDVMMCLFVCSVRFVLSHLGKIISKLHR